MVAARLGDHPLEQSRGSAPRRRPRAESSSCASRRRTASASRTCSSSATPRTRGPPAAGDRVLDPARAGRRSRRARRARRSSAAIWRRRSRAHAALARRARARARPGTPAEDDGTLPESGSREADQSRATLRQRTRAPDLTGHPGASHNVAATQSASSSDDVGHSLDLDRREQSSASIFGWTPSALAGRAEEERHRARLVGDHKGARRQLRQAAPRASRRRRSAGARAARSTLSASNARSATPDSTIAIVSASSSRFWLLKPPCCIRSSEHLLDRRQRAVGVEADVAEEDAVGPGDRLLAQGDRLRRR